MMEGFVDEENSLALFYYKEENLFRDCDGFVVLDLFRYVSPGYVAVFRENEINMVVPRRDKPGDAVILFAEGCDDDFKVYI